MFFSWFRVRKQTLSDMEALYSGYQSEETKVILDPYLSGHKRQTIPALLIGFVRAACLS